MKTNYYNDVRLSQSKLKTYLKCPNLFKALYLDHSIEPEETDALIIGRAVDTYITEGEESFFNNFEKVARRSKHILDTSPTPFMGTAEIVQLIIKDESKTQLTGLMFDIAQKMIGKIQQQPVMKMFKECDTQVELYDNDFKAKIDYLHISKTGTCTIADLKTIADTDKMYRQIEEYGYFFQLAFYKFLIT